jgi:hypothetical protein
MFIIPFVHTVINQPNINQTTININTIKILTIGGRNIWQEENILDIDKDILNPNDLYRATKKTIKLSNNIFLYEIDANKTNIDNFYKWEEIDYDDTETFCWKTYIQLFDTKNNNWLNIPDDEKLENISVKNIITAILKEKEKEKESDNKKKNKVKKEK